jgi:hypothetical protein
MRAEELEKLVRFKDTLNPDIWQNNNLRREVEYKLLLIAKEFINFINIPDLKLKDITLSGSNASYNYNDHSDLDLHLIVDMDTPCGAQLKELFQAKKSQFNDQYDILIRGHEVEVYAQDAKQPHISNGIYSVINDRWIKQPEKISANPDETNIKHKYEFLKAEIDRAIESGDPRAIARLQLKIKDMRKAGLEKSGEYGVENLAFKLLRNDGTLDALYSAKQKADDMRLSLPESLMEKINQKIIDPDFKAEKVVDIPSVGELRLVASGMKVVGAPQFNISVKKDDGKNIGYFRFVVADYEKNPKNMFGFKVKSKLDPYVVGGSVSVWDQYQKKGIATAVYKFVRELGNDIKPSSMQTDAGKSMWRSFEKNVDENFADGKKPGRKGLAKRMGVPTGASVTRLRQIAKNSTGEKARMAHWMANMKSGKKKD